MDYTQVRYKPEHFDVDAERALLSAVLSRPDFLDDIATSLKAEHFSAETHQVIYSTLLALFRAGKGIDAVTIKSRLQGKGNLERAGGEEYLLQLYTSRAVTRNITDYADIIRDKAVQRFIIDATSDVQAQLMSGEPVDTNGLLSRFGTEITTILETSVGHSPKQAGEGVDELWIELMRRYESGDPVYGLRSGISERLDYITGGLQGTDLVILAAESSVGKTSFGLQLASNIARGGGKVLYFSLEMSRPQLQIRLASQIGGLNAQEIQSGQFNVDPAEIKKHFDALKNISIVVDDRASLNVEMIYNEARVMKRKFGLDMIVVDYIGLLDGKNPSDEEYKIVTQASKQLKGIARAFDIPVIVLSQLNRVGNKQDERPTKSRLRSSGALEQDADMVWFLWHENPETPMERKYNATKPVTLIVEKQRRGPTEDIKLIFTKATTSFEEAPDEDFFGPDDEIMAPLTKPSKRDMLDAAMQVAANAQNQSQVPEEIDVVKNAQRQLFAITGNELRENAELHG